MFELHIRRNLDIQSACDQLDWAMLDPWKKRRHPPRGPLISSVFGGVNRVGSASFGGSSNVR